MSAQTDARGAVLRSKEFIGRDVMDPASSKVGTIRDLLLDRRSGKVRFIEVDLGTFKKRVIVPISRVEWGEEAFILRGMSAEQVRKLPDYDTDKPLTEDMLDELAWAYPSFYGEHDPDAIPSGFEGRNVVPMRDAKDFKVRKDEPDLRGWNVFGADGERAGKVADLLVDPAAMKVAYLEVDLFDDLFAFRDDRHVLVPAEAAEVRERGNDVWVRDLPARELARLPAYTGGPAEPYVMARVADAFGGSHLRGDLPGGRTDHYPAPDRDIPRGDYIEDRPLR